MRTRPFRIPMYLAFLAGEHPGLSRFDLLAMEQQCVMRQTVRRVTEKVSFRCKAADGAGRSNSSTGSIRDCRSSARSGHSFASPREPGLEGRRDGFFEAPMLPLNAETERKVHSTAPTRCYSSTTSTIRGLQCASASGAGASAPPSHAVASGAASKDSSIRRPMSARSITNCANSSWRSLRVMLRVVGAIAACCAWRTDLPSR